MTIFPCTLKSVENNHGKSFSYRRINGKSKTNQPAKKEVKKSLFSDTESSMKSSVLDPPLNNSGKYSISILKSTWFLLFTTEQSTERRKNQRKLKYKWTVKIVCN